MGKFFKKNKNLKENNETKKQPLGVENDINVVIKSREDGILFDQDCCTVINIILNNDNEIATSFLGIHNEQIIKELEKAYKCYFKALKKALKEERMGVCQSLLEETVPQKEQDDSPNPHISEYTPSNDKDVIKSKSGSFEHLCNDQGSKLVKKKINPKNSPNDKLDTPKKQ